jgi:hypothetical protein
MIGTGSTSAGVHCSEAWPPNPSVVTSKSKLPNLRFMGDGIFSGELPNDSIETPAVVTAETLMKFRRDNG